MKEFDMSVRYCLNSIEDFKKFLAEHEKNLSFKVSLYIFNDDLQANKMEIILL